MGRNLQRASSLSTARAAVFLPQSLANMGGGCFLWPGSHLGPRCPGNDSQTHGVLQYARLFGSQFPVQAGVLTLMGSHNCSGMGDSFPGSPERLHSSPLFFGRTLFFWAALTGHGGVWHFRPLSTLSWTFGHVCLISFLVCAPLLFISICWPSNSSPSGSIIQSNLISGPVSEHEEKKLIFESYP